MTWDNAQKKAVKLWGYRGATGKPPEGTIFPVFQVGRIYYYPMGGARFVVYGSGSSWEAAFRNARSYCKKKKAAV